MAKTAVYKDIPYLQEFSIRNYLPKQMKEPKLSSISVNRDGQIRILSDQGVLVPGQADMLYPGQLTEDISYPQLLSKHIKYLGTYQRQTIYLDEKQLFSNAWAGKLQIDHHMPDARLFAGGDKFHFLIADDKEAGYFDSSGNRVDKLDFKGLIQLQYSPERESFLLVSGNRVAEFKPGQPIIELYAGSGITAACYGNEHQLLVGTQAGYLILPGKQVVTKLPCSEITSISNLDGQVWFGTTHGAFYKDNDGKYRYYAGERWLPGNRVLGFERGTDHSILVLTDKGLGQICRQMMTLGEKALFFEKQVREKNIRYGFNCSSVRLLNGYASAQTGAQPSDNLWTGMYLASQLYRYKVTGSEEAKQNAFEAFEAMERLFTVTKIPGLFARSFERDYLVDTVRSAGWEEKELFSGSPESLWLPAADHKNWTWRSTASSDQTVGQLFALTTILELVEDADWKARALKCLDDLMGYIVKNDLYLIDVDGRPTLWGRWNPDYVNQFPVNVGDRKLNSSNIISFLQTAWHFTGKELYQKKAIEMMEKYGYLENLMRPIAQIGSADNDPLSKVLSHTWNHSDDEMYFLAYQGLYKYALSNDLKAKFKLAIQDHWESERPEGNALWNFIYAATGAPEFDLARSIAFLQDYPLDLRNWAVANSQRKDIELLPDNFRGQTTRELLPLAELPLYRHNGEIFKLDAPGDGSALISAGDVWLLPYWMGRYLQIIQ